MNNRAARFFFKKYLTYVTFFFSVSIIVTIISLYLYIMLAVPGYGTWGIFHYYLGAKYAKEVGYFDLYSCALATNDPSWKEVSIVRDLKTYKLIPTSELTACPRSVFTEKRWQSFKKDVALITSRAHPGYWKRALLDKGFNPPPLWIMLAQPLAENIDIGNSISYLIIFNLDLIAVFILTGTIWVFYGYKKASLILALTLSYFGTFGALGNNYLQYIWYPFLALTFIYWGKKQYSRSGICLGMSALLQAFPAIFALPVLAQLIFTGLNSNHSKPALKFLTAFGLTIITGILCLIIYFGDYRILLAWRTKIGLHAKYIRSEVINIGLPTLMNISISKDAKPADSYIDDYTHTLNRIKLAEKNTPLIYGATLSGILCILMLQYFSKHRQPLIYGFFLVFAAVSLSPYYYLFLALLPLLFVRQRQLFKYSSTGLFVLFLLNLFVFPNGYVTFSPVHHLVSNLSILVFYILIIYLMHRSVNRAELDGSG